MTRYLINRPIAVLMTFMVLLIFGAWAMFRIPVSLLPAIDVPQIVVKVNYPNTPAASLEENVMRPLRESLTTLYQLKDIESLSTNHTGTMHLTFEYGTRMDLAFIEVNEKLDRVTNTLPKDLARPQVVRINTSDVPIARLQILPQHKADYLQVSELAEKVIKKRIEQIDGVSLVDINGKQSAILEITPISEKLQAAKVLEQDLISSIRQSNLELGSLSVRDGHYRYFVKLANRLEGISDIERLPVKLQDGISIPMKELAHIRHVSEDVTGYHLLNDQRGLVITIHKQAQARMNEVVLRVRESMEVFRKDYPQINFSLTQDQSFVLDAGIGNLYQSIIFGGIFCISLLFLFMGNFASPLLMGISIPASLFITFIFFYAFNISFNIISLSGLALGIGMLIDNSIVVLDRIARKRRSGLSIDDSCEIGVNEVVAPVVSTVLTSVAVYAPLIYLSGLAGALVYDQAIALTVSLVVSLLIAFFLNPVLYKLFLKHNPEDLKEDTRFYASISNIYSRMIKVIFNHKRLFFMVTLLMIPFGLSIGTWLPITNLPSIEQTETLVVIDWNEPIQLNESERRVYRSIEQLKKCISVWEADVGLKQFLLNIENQTVQKAEIYYRCHTPKDKEKADQILGEWFNTNYPQATYNRRNAPNAFTQLFEDRIPYFEARFRPLNNQIEASFAILESRLLQLTQNEWQKGLGLLEEQTIEMLIDNDKLALYNVSYDAVSEQLKRLFGRYTISEIKRFGEVKAVLFKTENEDIQSKLRWNVIASNGTHYPLNTFITWSLQKDSRYLTSDKSGVYKSFILAKADNIDMDKLQNHIKRLANDTGLAVEFKGNFFTYRQLLVDMIVIFMISSLLLYVILAVEFENLVHPFLVMLSMPLGIAGSMLALWLSGGALDIMAAVGFIIVLGIVVDDPILKIETINRLRKQYTEAGLNKKEALKKAIHEAGEICLKPLLLTSLTTCFALLPILFMPGIGADLQKPMVWVVLGGLTIGTSLSFWFIPLAYWYTTSKN